VKLNIQELRNAALSAQVVAQTMVGDLERRMPFRRVMKQTMERVMKAGAVGVKLSVGGRLNGAEIARTEKMAKGSVPLITLRSDVDYASIPAYTMYGKIGVKVWICHGEVFGRKDMFAEAAEAPQKKSRSA
jgi:small subunit ribosomal protein S3